MSIAFLNAEVGLNKRLFSENDASLYHLLCMIDHGAAKGRYTGGDVQAGQDTHSGA